MALLWKARLLPVLRAADADTVRRDLALVAAAGFRVVELTAGTPGWETALAAAREEHPGIVFGVGLLRHANDAERAAAAGARFLVSPWPAPAVRAAAFRVRLPLMEGGLTPGEIAAALQYGPARLFPAHAVGLPYLRSLLAALPNAEIVPGGGVALADVPAWLDAGALAVAVGGDLLAGLRRDPAGVAQRLAELSGERSPMAAS